MPRCRRFPVSMIALGGPKLKLDDGGTVPVGGYVSMIALGGPKLKLAGTAAPPAVCTGFNDSTGWA